MVKSPDGALARPIRLISKIRRCIADFLYGIFVDELVAAMVQPTASLNGWLALDYQHNYIASYYEQQFCKVRYNKERCTMVMAALTWSLHSVGT